MKLLDIERLYALEGGELMTLEDDMTTALRVPGGWLFFLHDPNESTRGVFIPWSDDLQTNNGPRAGDSP